MAGSRLEKIGSIYTRTAGLLRSRALNWEDRPLWYDIYEAFPPQNEPRYDRVVANTALKSIFYKEDGIRALFSRNNKYVGAVSMFNNNYKSLTQKFIENYKILENRYNGKVTQEQLYTETIEILKREKETQKEGEEEVEPISISMSFTEAKSSQEKNVEEQKIKVNVRNIFKD